MNIYEGGASANLTFTNVENINLFAPGLVIGNQVITVEPTGESSRAVAFSALSSAIHGVINQRMTHTTPLKPVKVAALTVSPGMLFQEREPVAWAQVFGRELDREAEGGALAYENSQVGFTLGYEWDINKSRFGLVGGAAHGNTNTQVSSFRSDADHYYVGAYGHFNLGQANLTTSLLASYGD